MHTSRYAIELNAIKNLFMWSLTLNTVILPPPPPPYMLQFKTLAYCIVNLVILFDNFTDLTIIKHKQNVINTVLDISKLICKPDENFKSQIFFLFNRSEWPVL